MNCPNCTSDNTVNNGHTELASVLETAASDVCSEHGCCDCGERFVVNATDGIVYQFDAPTDR